MRIHFSLQLLLLLVLSAGTTTCRAPQPTAAPAAGQDYGFYLGTYDGDHDPGIYHFTLTATGQLRNDGRVAKASNPSYLALSEKHDLLLAVEELQEGQFLSFTPAEDTLLLNGRLPTRGAHPCHVSIASDGITVVSNYSGGNIALYGLLDEGKFQELDVAEHNRLGGNRPHAHSSYFPEISRVISVDLGTDALWQYRTDELYLTPAEPERLELTPGSGPRHLAFHPNGRWAYVINEYAGSITRVSGVASGKLRAEETVTTLPADYRGENACADVDITADGRYLYGSNRGHNSIAAFRVDPGNGRLTLIEHESVAGDWPRNMALSPDERYLLVANQRSNSLTSLRRNGDGSLTYISKTAAPTPVCILFE